MNEWGVVGVVIALVGLIATIAGPLAKVSAQLSKNSAIQDGMLDRLNKLENADKEFQESARQAHSRIHDRIDGVEEKVNDHEVRITTLEKSGGS